jgi:hypothetical protein
MISCVSPFQRHPEAKLREGVVEWKGRGLLGGGGGGGGEGWVVLLLLLLSKVAESPMWPVMLLLSALFDAL